MLYFVYTDYMRPLPAIPIFKQHIIFLFNGNAALANGDAVPESDEALFSTEAVKERASAIVGKAAVHTMEVSAQLCIPALACTQQYC